LAPAPLPPPPAPPPDVANYTVLQLDPLPGDLDAQAHDINDMGQVTGWSSGPVKLQTGVVWNIDQSRTVTVQDLGTLPGGTFSFAEGINNLGQIVGFADDALANRRPFIWTASGGIRDLGVPVGMVGGQAHRINDHGQI
jgi:probable HAF family extracellular repeat protein